MKKRILFILLIIIILLEGCRRSEYDAVMSENANELQLTEVTDDLENENQKTDTFDEAAIFVHICGEVVKPGVYELKAGSRLYELLERAGGYTAEADADSLNQAELLYDAQQIIVPSRNAASDVQSGGKAYTEAADGRVNINTADKAQLMEIPCIGESRAADIIDYRERNGLFKKAEDIMQVPGIKDGLYSKIKDRIKI